MILDLKSIIFFVSFILSALGAGFLVSQFSPSMMLSAMGAAGIFLIAFLNTEWGLFLLIFSMLLSPEITVGTTSGATLGRGVSLRLDDFLLLVIGLTWFFKTAYFKNLGLLKKTCLNNPIFLYILVCAFSTGAGIMAGRVSPKTGFFYVLKYFEYCFVFFMIVNHVESKEQVKKFIFCILLTCFITSIVGIIQIPSGARVSAPFEGETGEPNTFGGYLVFIGAIAGGLFSTSDNLKGKVLTGFLICVMIFPFIYTRSRSSYLAFIPMVLILGAMSERKVLVLSVMLLCLALSPLFLPGAVKERIFYTFNQPKERGQIQIGKIRIDTSTSERLNSWKNAVKNWTKHPLIGYGVTGYPFIDAQFPKVLVETGIIGLSAFIYLLYSIFRLGFKNLKILKDPYHIGITRGFIAGSAGLVFHAIGANTFIIVRIMEPFWFLAGIAAVLYELENKSISSHN
ncbi:O-Antigen ligase domain-containing protein [Desulfonema limicola]|uniref:O-Antigen ligase domain-containing protein n=1 Tax=Desulfonema limicola TaxID=45656 RepID=A0A975GFS5_9BACT|nr:O-antigen ligase family protein [Desulfonema limicola]QTA79470.1 O-Antigen ligase domain-containing protein [Desulfonema limicola]